MLYRCLCIEHILILPLIKHVFVWASCIVVFFQGSNPSDLLEDERFAAMFTNPDFQVDEESEVSQILVFV